MPATPKSDAQRRLRLAKDSERELGRWQIEHDGPDPRFPPGGGMVTSTGRVGHITNLQFDTLSRSYAGENKHIRLNKELLEWWVKVVSKAWDEGKEPLLRFDPANKPETFTYHGFKRRIPKMHIITQERHEELLRAERALISLQSGQK